MKTEGGLIFEAAELYKSAATSIPRPQNLAVTLQLKESVHKDLVLAYKWVLLDISA